MELPFVSLFIVSVLGYLMFFIGREKLKHITIAEKVPLMVGLGLCTLVLFFGAVHLLTNLY